MLVLPNGCCVPYPVLRSRAGISPRDCLDLRSGTRLGQGRLRSNVGASLRLHCAFAQLHPHPELKQVVEADTEDSAYSKPS